MCPADVDYHIEAGIIGEYLNMIIEFLQRFAHDWAFYLYVLLNSKFRMAAMKGIRMNSIHASQSEKPSNTGKIPSINQRRETLQGKNFDLNLDILIAHVLGRGLRALTTQSHNW